MKKSGLIASWVAIFGVLAIVLGEMDHASKVDPSYVKTGHTTIRGVVFPPF
jgi:hypothetical protein